MSFFVYSAYKDRKKLLSEFSHFACDARVMTQLYNVLGTVFGTSHPVPIDFEHHTKLPGALQKSLDSTYMHIKGSSITVRMGNLSMNPNDVTQNILHGIEFAVGKLKNCWKGIQNVHIKTPDSPSLPIYTKGSTEIISFIKAMTGDEEGRDEPKSSKDKKRKEIEKPMESVSSKKRKESARSSPVDPVLINMATTTKKGANKKK